MHTESTNAIDRIYILPSNDSYSESNYQELTELLIEQGIALTDTNGAYRSVYDILKDLADGWKDMGDIIQSDFLFKQILDLSMDAYEDFLNAP